MDFIVTGGTTIGALPAFVSIGLVTTGFAKASVFTGANGFATAESGFCAGPAGVLLVASGFSLVDFWALSGIGLRLGPAALAIVLIHA